MLRKFLSTADPNEARMILRRALSLDQPKMWVFALIVGVASGYAALFFYLTVGWLQRQLYGADEAAVETGVAALDWWLVILIPMAGGAVVGTILAVFSESGRPASVSEIIEASRIKDCQLSGRTMTISAAVSAISLGFGASTGREGPVVHLGASLASMFAHALRLNTIESRTLLGCAAAAAVSSSFNAPIAGALFALEVVLGYYAVRAFAPIVVASVAGAVISRYHLGDFPAFIIPERALVSFWELPAFGLLGIVCAITATLLMYTIIVADKITDMTQEELHYPLWIEPVIGGALIGMLALVFPQVIGIGYEATGDVLGESFGFWTIIAIIVAKTAAVAITLATRFGGGVFSPSLMLGAFTGGAFGIVATSIFPDFSGTYGLYALAGMGAVAAAVLGAPISTSLIVFELTGDYQTAIAVLITVSVASVLTQQTIERSYFHWRLGNRGLHLGDGPQRYLLDTMLVSSTMLPRGSEGSPSETQSWELIEQGVMLEADDKLSKALPMFKSSLTYIPVVSMNEGGGRTLTGALFHVDALRAYNRALVEAHEEEHG